MNFGTGVFSAMSCFLGSGVVGSGVVGVRLTLSSFAFVLMASGSSVSSKCFFFWLCFGFVGSADHAYSGAFDKRVFLEKIGEVFD
jgi:hypothetical protein